MGAKSRRKGAAGEREVAEFMSAVYPDAERGLGQARSGGEVPDVDGCGSWWIEVKRNERPNPHAAYAQAAEATDGRLPLVVSRRSRGPWLATLALGDLLDELKELDELRRENARLRVELDREEDVA